ncbi:MFS transporter [Sphingomonas sp. C8-2]|nr:MFS transporter [Sphingomonas sp. C8-2]
MDQDAPKAMADAPMTPFQFAVVLLCCVINMADGADVIVMAYAAPLIARQWQITPEVLGMVFAAAPVGMAIGAFGLAPLADRVGRRVIILSAFGGITICMLLTGVADTVPMLAAVRLLTGIGLGTLLASLTVIIVEYTNRRWGNFFIAVFHIGFALGASLMGIVAASLADDYGWRSFFIVGGSVNLLIFAVSLFLLPESVEFLMESHPRNALARINRIFARIGRAPLSVLPSPSEKVKRGGGLPSLLRPPLRRPSLLLWAASMGYTVVSYYHLNWTPHVLADAGVAAHLAISSGVFTGTGAIAGNLSMGVLSSRTDTVRLTAFYFLGAAISLAGFGLIAPNAFGMFAAATLISFFTLGGFSGLMIVTSRQYPALVRSTGVGAVVGFGRFGAAFGPMLGGLMIGAGLPLSTSYLVFAAFASIPFMMLLTLRARPSLDGPMPDALAAK